MTRPSLAAAIALAAPVTFAAMVGASARAGGIQDDIEACGAEAVTAGLIEADGTSLHFVSDQGNRNRTLTLKVIGGDAEPMEIDCKIKRSEVIEVVAAEPDA